MKNVIILSIAILFTSFAFANNSNFNEIVIPKNFKTDRTFSGDLSDTDSFHLILGKNIKTKNYHVFTYLSDGINTTKLPTLTNRKPYKILSFHYKNNTLSLLVTYNLTKKKSYLKRIDYNLKENTLKESEELKHENFEKVLRVKDRSIIIYKDGEVLSIKEFIGNNPLNIKTLKIDKFSRFSDYFKNKYVAFVSNDEFVKNGSTSKLKLYYSDNSLNFTKDTDLFRSTELVKLNLSKDSLFKEKRSFDKVEMFFIASKILRKGLKKYPV